MLGVRLGVRLGNAVDLTIGGHNLVTTPNVIKDHDLDTVMLTGFCHQLNYVCGLTHILASDRA